MSSVPKPVPTALKIVTDDDLRNKFQQSVDCQHTMAVRTSEKMRKMVLLPTESQRETRLSDFAKGEVDPLLQLVLIARDSFSAAEDDASRLGFFKAMKDVFLEADKKTMAVMDMAMKERHHQEKLNALREKAGLTEPTDAELEKEAGDA